LWISIGASAVAVIALLAAAWLYYQSQQPTRLHNPDGTLQYEGKIEDGVQNGFGKAFGSSGQVIYEGQWVGGKYEGEGTSSDEQGAVIFQGTFKEGQPWTGKGAVKNGNASYNGELKDGKYDGQGDLTESDVLVYSGRFAA